MAFPKRPEDTRRFFEFSAVVSSLGQEQASKSEGSSGRFVGLGVILCLGCFVGCFVFQEYDGRIPKVFAFFKSRMKGYTSFIVS